MQIRNKFGDYEIEVLKAPFGQAEPIGLLFEGNGQKICWHDFTWKQLNEMCGCFHDKFPFQQAEKRKIHWNGETLFVKDGEEEMSIPMPSMEGTFSLGMMIFFRSIDPY